MITAELFEKNNERWPMIGDQLLKLGRDASLAESSDERSVRMLRGYKRAGDILIEQILVDPAERRNLIFPALFVYRHYIEIALKYLIEQHGPSAGIKPAARSHRLPDLWQAYVELSKDLMRSRDNTDFFVVGKIIEEMAKIDGNSTTFRYAKNVKGETVVLPEGVDAVNLQGVMCGVENFFECADLHFSEGSRRKY